MADPCRRDRQLIRITRKPFADRCHDRSIFLLIDLDLLLAHPVQLDLIERRIAGNRRVMPVRLRSEIELGFAGHDDMHRIVRQRCHGEFVRRSQAGLRGHKRPGPDARIGTSGLSNSQQCEQRECKNEASSTDILDADPERYTTE